MAFDPECVNCRIVRGSALDHDECAVHRDPENRPPNRAKIARKVRAAFDDGKLHTSTWGRAFYVGPGEDDGNAGATMLIMHTLDKAGVFDGD